MGIASSYSVLLSPQDSIWTSQESPGMSRMTSLSRLHIWFPNIDKEIKKLVKTCETCEKLSNNPNKSPPNPWDWSIEPIDHVHIDLFEFENKNFLAMVDSNSKWIEIKVANSWKTGNTIKTLSFGFHNSVYQSS